VSKHSLSKHSCCGQHQTLRKKTFLLQEDHTMPHPLLAHTTCLHATVLQHQHRCLFDRVAPYHYWPCQAVYTAGPRPGTEQTGMQHMPEPPAAARNKAQVVTCERLVSEMLHNAVVPADISEKSTSRVTTHVSCFRWLQHACC
jgi:hypothetical protein